MNKTLKRKILFFTIAFMFLASAMQTSAANPDIYTVRLNSITKDNDSYSSVNGYIVKYVITLVDLSTTTKIGPNSAGTEITTTGYEFYSIVTKLYLYSTFFNLYFLKDYKVHDFHLVHSGSDTLSFTLSDNGYDFYFTNTFVAEVVDRLGGGRPLEPMD